jgi:hypothetical protein
MTGYRTRRTVHAAVAGLHDQHRLHSVRRLPQPTFSGPHKREGRLLRALRRLRILPREAA